jgi:hypothetical protein
MMSKKALGVVMQVAIEYSMTDTLMNIPATFWDESLDMLDKH